MTSYLDNLVASFVRRNIESILVGNFLTYEPSTNIMPSLEPLDKRLRCGERNHSGRLIPFTRAILRWPSLNIPRAWRIHRKYWNLAFSQCSNNSWERFSDFSSKGKAKDCVNDPIVLSHRTLKVVGERDLEVFELCPETAVELVLRLLWIVHGGFVAEMMEVASRDK